jgi:transcription antitermination protein NusB
MGVRRLGRECAVQFLYQQDLNPDKNLEHALKEFWKMTEPSKSAQDFAEGLIRGIADKIPEMDAKIKSLAENWDLSRLAVVDRNILRLALYEMLYCQDIPPVVTINEAIEIAKRYSTEESGKFVNGILDRAKKDILRPARHAAGGEA